MAQRQNKEKLKDDYAGVDIKMADGSSLPSTRGKRSRKKKPVLNSTQLVNGIDVSLGDKSTGASHTVNMPIQREGALMMSYGLACAMAQTAERWFVSTLNDMEESGETPSADEMKDMINVVKTVQDTLNKSWEKAYSHSNNRQDSGTGIHAPVLNQFFKIENMIHTQDGKTPNFEDVLQTMHELKVTESDSIQELQGKKDEAKKSSEIEVVSEDETITGEGEQDKKEEAVKNE